MRYRVLLVGVLLGLAAQAANIPAASAPAQTQNKSTSKAQQTLAGCVDERDGKYVLLDGDMKKMVGLRAAASSDENVLAKHMGHMVRVRGAADSKESGEFIVTAIEPIAGNCGGGR